MRPRRAGDSTSSPQAEPLPSGLRNQTDPDVNHLHQALHRPTGLALCRMRKPQTAPTACPKHVRTGVSVGAFSVRHRFSTASIQYGIDRQEGSAPMTGRSFSGCLFPPAFFLPGFSCRGFPARDTNWCTRHGPGLGLDKSPGAPGPKKKQHRGNFFRVRWGMRPSVESTVPGRDLRCRCEARGGSVEDVGERRPAAPEPMEREPHRERRGGWSVGRLLPVPPVAIEGSVLNRLRDVGGFDVVRFGKVGDRAGHL